MAKKLDLVNYTGSPIDIIEATANIEPEAPTVNKIAWYIDGYYKGTNGAGDVILEDTPVGATRNPNI